MDKKLIAPIYKILLLYEDVGAEGSDVREADYMRYLDRLYVRYLGYGEKEIYDTIKGLYILGASASHNTVKASVFHMIDLIEKGVIKDGV